MVEMARINKKVKLFIVKMLAEFNTTTETAKAVKAVFSIEVSQQQCECYDPTKKMGYELSQELKEKFFQYRKIANEELEAIPLANKRYRLQLLQNLVEKFPDNPMLTPKWAEQAAKEMGGLFTNRQEITGKNGEPLVGLSDEELDRRIKEAESKAKSS